MKFENVSFSQAFIDKVKAGMSREDYVANTGHSLTFEQGNELYNLIHGYDQKLAGQLEKAGHEQSGVGELGTDAGELH